MGAALGCGGVRMHHAGQCGNRAAPFGDQRADPVGRGDIQAMQLEAEMQTNPNLRADVFVRRWRALERQRRYLLDRHETTRANTLGDRMIGMAKGLERDPQVESLLRNRRVQLGLPAHSVESVGRALGEMIGRGRSRGLEIGM